MKFRVLSNFVDTDQLIEQMPLSDYSAYTEPKFQQIETSDSVLLKVIFSFFIYTVPSNLLICFICYWIFKAIYKFKVSILFRRYYFFTGTIIQILFEGNISYFTFCCFNHLGHSFSFSFADKLSLLFTVMFLFIVLMLSISFYFLIGHLYKKLSSYFIYCFYRCNQSYWYLMMYNMGF